MTFVVMQIESLAAMYHLEVGPAKGKSSLKALHVTKQTAQLSTGGMMQVVINHFTGRQMQ